MDYEVGSIADLISGTVTPGRAKVTLTPVTPVKREKVNDEVTPKAKAAKNKKTPKINITVEDHDEEEEEVVSSKKKKKQKKTSEFQETFKFLSQVSDDDDVTETTKKVKESEDPKRVVKEFFVGKDGKMVEEGNPKKRKHSEEDISVKAENNKKKTKKRHEEIEEESDVSAKKKKKKSKKRANEEAENIEEDSVIENEQDSDHQEEIPEDEEIDDDDDDDVKELSDFQKAAERRINSKIQREQKFDDSELSKTLFVGNIPVSILKKNHEKILKQKFKPYGQIESIRIRNIPLQDLLTKPKVALIEKSFHPERNAAIAYIKFVNPGSVTKALVENNSLLEGNHIRVDRCYKEKVQVDGKKCIFLGNLPFNVEEETIRNTFESCGEITSIRVVRDHRTQVGKGIAFINFTKSDGVEMALAMARDDVVIGNKNIRIQRYVVNAKDRKIKENSNRKFNNDDNRPSKFEKGPKTWNKKKRDEQGNKLRKYSKTRERPGRKFKPENDVNSEKAAETENGVDTAALKKDKQAKHQEYKGLMAVKKKKFKKSKAILEKKKISKILLQPLKKN